MKGGNGAARTQRDTMTNEVAVTIPSIKRGAWWRHVTATNRHQTGAQALLGGGESGSWLRTGEQLLPVGAVLVEAGSDDSARVWVVAYDGTLIPAPRPTGETEWISYRKAILSLCDRVESMLSVTQEALLQADLELAQASADTASKALAKIDAELAAMPPPPVDRTDYLRKAALSSQALAAKALAQAQARVVECEARLASAPAADPRAELLAERERLLARLDEIDALLDR